MSTEKIPDFRKFKCAAGKCHAPLPEVYCERVMILRREIPRFIELLDALGDDVVLSYHILPPKHKDSDDSREMDRTWIIIWVDPRKHHAPEYLVQAAANMACKGYTLQEELDFFNNERSDDSYRQISREVNCPVCIKNHLDTCRRAMSHEQYIKSLAATAGIFD